MIGSSCNNENCPGTGFAVIAGISMIFMVMLTFFSDAHAGVRVDITRDTPDEIQHIVRLFEDEDEFGMWFTTRLEDGCDPYVSKINIIRDYHPVSLAN